MRWISDIAGAGYLKATYQLDWWHYEKKLRAALPGEMKLQQELMNLSGKVKSKVAAREVLVVGSGGVEKNIDLMLCRRFKGRGMSWGRAGAQNLLKLRLLRYDHKDWKAYGRRRVN